MTLNVAIIVGSLRKDSMNLKLAKALQKLGANAFEASFVNIADLPLMNQDLEGDYPAAFPKTVVQVKQAIEAADAVLIVTPEYNRSIPAPLKNALDWASRPYGKNSFAKKPAAIIGTSQGAIGTAAAQQHLKPVLNYLDMTLMGQPEAYVQFKPDMIDADGNIENADTQKFLQKFVDSFTSWVQTHAQARTAKAA